MKTFRFKTRGSPVVLRRTMQTGLVGKPHLTNQRMLIRNAINTTLPQAKLTIGAPNDIYEKEADQVADQVMRMPDPQLEGASQTIADSEQHIQRMCPECDDEMQRQPMEEEEEEEELQAKAEPGHTPEVSGDVESNINSLQGDGEPLSEGSREFFESRMGYDFSGVRVHSGNQAADTAQSVNAKAFTLGSDIVFGGGQYAPESHEGRRLLAHELTHVVQQKG